MGRKRGLGFHVDVARLSVVGRSVYPEHISEHV